jgi:hypothetical protein
LEIKIRQMYRMEQMYRQVYSGQTDGQHTYPEENLRASALWSHRKGGFNGKAVVFAKCKSS